MYSGWITDLCLQGFYFHLLSAATAISFDIPDRIPSSLLGEIMAWPKKTERGSSKMTAMEVKIVTAAREEYNCGGKGWSNYENSAFFVVMAHAPVVVPFSELKSLAFCFSLQPMERFRAACRRWPPSHQQQNMVGGHPHTDVWPSCQKLKSSWEIISKDGMSQSTGYRTQSFSAIHCQLKFTGNQQSLLADGCLTAYVKWSGDCSLVLVSIHPLHSYHHVWHQLAFLLDVS